MCIQGPSSERNYLHSTAGVHPRGTARGGLEAGMPAQGTEKSRGRWPELKWSRGQVWGAQVKLFQGC